MFVQNLQAAVLSISILVLAGFALVLSPLAGPAEGFTIRTHTDIHCIGTVTESSSFRNTGYSGSGPLSPGTGGDFNSGSEEAYQSDFRALNGETYFFKDFRADSSTAPNVAAETFISFTPDPGSPLSIAVFEEKIGLSLVSAGGGLDMAGLLSLCPWAVGHGPGAGCTGVAAGSKFRVSEINNFYSGAQATSTGVPSLSYEVDAADRQGGFAGDGRITASMVVQISESGAQWTDGQLPPLQSRTVYSESSTADGLWNFSKQMDWKKRYGDLGSLDPLGDLF